jgi:hypothetical protein
MTQFDPGQQTEALALLEEMAWGDYLRNMEGALRLALEATTDDFYGWEEELGPAMEADGYDEFSVPPARLEELSLEEKVAYVARLLRTLALAYGVSAEFGVGQGGLVGQAHQTSPASLLRGLNDVLWLPTAVEE